MPLIEIYRGLPDPESSSAMPVTQPIPARSDSWESVTLGRTLERSIASGDLSCIFARPPFPSQTNVTGMKSREIYLSIYLPRAKFPLHITYRDRNDRLVAEKYLFSRAISFRINENKGKSDPLIEFSSKSSHVPQLETSLTLCHRRKESRKALPVALTI